MKEKYNVKVILGLFLAVALAFSVVPNAEAAWWNESMTRWPIFSADNATGMFLLNDTYGVDSGTGPQYIWPELEFSETPFAYNDTNQNWYVANSTSQLYSFVDEGNGTDYGTPEESLQLWVTMNGTTDKSIYNFALTDDGTNDTSGKIGKARKFVIADTDEVKTDTEVPGSTTRSISLWVNETDTSAAAFWIGSDDGVANWNNINWYFGHGVDNIELALSTDGVVEIFTCVKAGNLTDNTWTHMAATWSGLGNPVTIFRDGLPCSITTATETPKGLTKVIHIGKRYDGFHMGGEIDNVQIWNRTLSDGEIENIYNNTHPDDYITLGAMETYSAPSADEFYATTQISPGNATNVCSNPPGDFCFSYTGTYATASCELLIGSGGYGVNVSTLNATTTCITANASVASDGTYDWSVNCTNSTDYNQSVQWEFYVDTTPPQIAVTSLDNISYTTIPGQLNWTSDDIMSWSGYSFNGAANVTFPVTDYRSNVSSYAVNSTYWHGLSRGFDDDYETWTAASMAQDSYMWLNWTIPQNTESAILGYEYNGFVPITGDINFTITSSCLTGNMLEVLFISDSSSPVNGKWWCWDGSAWSYLGIAGYAIYEVDVWFTGWYNTTVSPSQGPNNVTIYANDSCGNLNSSTVSFYVDTHAPTISGVSQSPITCVPSPGVVRMEWQQQDNLDDLTVYCNFTNAAGASTIISSIVQTANATSTCSLLLASLGQWHIEVNITDYAGNTILHTGGVESRVTCAGEAGGGGGGGGVITSPIDVVITVFPESESEDYTYDPITGRFIPVGVSVEDLTPLQQFEAGILVPRFMQVCFEFNATGTDGNIYQLTHCAFLFSIGQGLLTIIVILYLWFVRRKRKKWKTQDWLLLATYIMFMFVSITTAFPPEIINAMLGTGSFVPVVDVPTIGTGPEVTTNAPPAATADWGPALYEAIAGNPLAIVGTIIIAAAAWYIYRNQKESRKLGKKIRKFYER